MKNFYKLDKNGKLEEIGSGKIVKEGCKEYTKGQEPQELLNAMAMEKNIPISKEEQLNTLIVTTKNGHRIYADEKSCIDLVRAELKANRNNIPNDYTTLWKTADGWRDITIGDIKEANDLALDEKAKLIGMP